MIDLISTTNIERKQAHSFFFLLFVVQSEKERKKETPEEDHHPQSTSVVQPETPTLFHCWFVFKVLLKFFTGFDER